MFTEFCRLFDIKDYDNTKKLYTNKLNKLQYNSLGFNELMSNFEGKSFGSGLYRVHKLHEIDKWNKIILEEFPEFNGRIDCFAYDWMGRQFSLDCTRTKNGDPEILMFEPGTGEAFEIPCTIREFHNNEIVNYSDICLSSNMFNEWNESNKYQLLSSECVGYIVPLFLGGVDELGNLEVSDMEVYWSICSQIVQGMGRTYKSIL